MLPTVTKPAPNGAFSELCDYLPIHFANTDFNNISPNALAADLFRQFVVFLGTEVESWYIHFRAHFHRFAQKCALSINQAECVLRGGQFALCVHEILAALSE